MCLCLTERVILQFSCWLNLIIYMADEQRVVYTCDNALFTQISQRLYFIFNTDLVFELPGHLRHKYMQTKHVSYSVVNIYCSYLTLIQKFN